MTTSTARGLSRGATVGALAALLVATTLSAPSHAGNIAKLTRIQTNTVLALPGVTLPPGSYTFELANPDSSRDTVMVSSGTSHRRVHFLGLARRVSRPQRMPANQVIAVGEAPRGEPVPITAWFPAGGSSGHQFLYH